MGLLYLDWELFFSLSPEQFEIKHLGIFLGIFLFLFLGRAAYRRRQFVQARNKIPLVIGGWGTRGKSGVERLKAAIFHELGYNVFSKTTGCDAMFLFNGFLPKLQDFYLFRPYEKASIWEQRDCVILAKDLKAEVFLWECMALNPLYAQQLQEDWMKDQLSTITNTYPDHEDIQGPSGINVAESLSYFIPKKAPLITSEEQMLPLLEQKAKEKEAQVLSVSWREAYLIPEDILQRIPYQEHPMNIALVTEMGKQIGISKEQVWKGIGEHVVPDLGVLKIIGPLTYRERKITFINGMSANERLASLGNWKRCKLDQHHPLTNRNHWIVTVVNNRADRISRSRVFAQILIEDIFANAHFMIGTNLSGFRNYLQHSFKHKYQQEVFSFSSAEEFHSWLCGYKIPYFPWEEVMEFLSGMLAGLNQENLFQEIKAESLFWKELENFKESDHFFPLKPSKNLATLKSLEELLVPLKTKLSEKLSERLVSEVLSFFIEAFWLHCHLQHFWKNWLENPATDNAYHLLQSLLNRNQFYLENPEASGDSLIEFLTSRVPPGFQITIMGMQNIKQTTSMEFVQHWLAVEQFQKRLLMLKQNVLEESFKEELLWFQKYQEWSLLTCELVLTQFSEMTQIPEGCKSLFKTILEGLKETQKNLLIESQRAMSTNWWKSFLCEIEKLLDSTDSKRRRRASWKFYQQYSQGKISQKQLAFSLKKISSRQKGGWLNEMFQKESTLPS